MKRFLAVLLVLFVFIAPVNAMELRQSTDVNIPIGPFLDVTDGTTRETALVIAYDNVRLAKKGGTVFAVKSDTNGLKPSATAPGWYWLPLNTTDTATAGWLVIDVNDINGVPVWNSQIEVVCQNWYDAKYGVITLPVTEPNFTPTATPTIIVANQTTLRDAIDANGNAIQAKTVLIPASPAAVGSAMTLDSATHTLIAADVNHAFASAATAIVFEGYVEATFLSHTWPVLTISGDVDINDNSHNRAIIFDNSKHLP